MVHDPADARVGRICLTLTAPDGSTADFIWETPDRPIARARLMGLRGAVDCGVVIRAGGRAKPGQINRIESAQP